MATLHRATLTPTKLELLSAWAPEQPWWPHPGASTIELAADYRLDDPEGEVGVQVHLLRTGPGHVLQVPVTYRGAPLQGADEHLIGTTSHSVLGQRWLYDGCADPVCVQVMAAAAMTGGAQASLEVLSPTGRELRAPSMTVKGSGVPGTEVPTLSSLHYQNGTLVAVVDAGTFLLRVLRLPGPSQAVEGTYLLNGRWEGWPAAVTLAGVSLQGRSR